MRSSARARWPRSRSTASCAIFHDGLGHDHDAMCAAARDYFAAAGRIDPCDVIGLPDAVPRMTQLRTRVLLRPFDAALDAAIARRRRALDSPPRHGRACPRRPRLEHGTTDVEAPRDMLAILLCARDPD